MNTEQFTNWFDGSVMPFYMGVYQTAEDRYARFDGAGWYKECSSLHDANHTMTPFSGEDGVIVIPARWRGLTVETPYLEPEVDLFAEQPAGEPEVDLFAGSL